MSKQVEHGQRGQKRRQRDLRFQQLCELARDGNVEAIADLFREYGFRIGEDEL